MRTPPGSTRSTSPAPARTGTPVTGSCGAPGDDLLFGPDKIHALDDVLRRWLEQQPAIVAHLTETAPDGPLVVSHRTGKRRTSAGTGRRFDAIWVSPDLGVQAVDYPYDDCVAAGSDHAVVVADLTSLAAPSFHG
jgi:hypothetical protein